MKRFMSVFALGCLIVISACSALRNTPTQNPPKDTTATLPASAYPQDETVIPPTATLTEQQILDACTETIKAYAVVDRCTNWSAYHELFSAKGPYFNATPEPDGGTYCHNIESAEVVKILPVEEWWNSGNPGKELPPSAKPTLLEERVFYVEIYLTMKPEGGPAPDPNPISQLMWMIPENGKCLIRTYGW
ncbi:MAG: hypothetical protein HYZ25_03230 [Chloroflexi bacterium]|nr:hypothetical protein [Chloroflexota bacterium]